MVYAKTLMVLIFFFLIPTINAETTFFDNQDDFFIMPELPEILGAGGAGGGIGEGCEYGWKCKDNQTLGFQLLNCSWTSVKECSYKCSNGKCIEDIFVGIIIVLLIVYLLYKI